MWGRAHRVRREGASPDSLPRAPGQCEETEHRKWLEVWSLLSPFPEARAGARVHSSLKSTAKKTSLSKSRLLSTRGQ